MSAESALGIRQLDWHGWMRTITLRVQTDMTSVCESAPRGCFSPQAHACDNTCTLPCGETDDDMGHRRQMKNSENIDVGETVSASFYAPASADKK
eukprot:COSAG06_NODE_30877_length_530_cov_5.517401_1_plen_94_part_10